MAAPADAIADLYLEPFDGFVAARNELAKRLRSEGDAEAATSVRALRKPSRVAWALDQVSGREPDLRDALLSAGAALRDAQERLVAGKGSSSDVREAAAREREAVEAALEATGRVAADSGSALSSVAVERARQTLHAVALDEDVRAEFEAHRLTGEHQAAGLGGFGLEGDVPAPPRRPKRRGSAKDDEREQAKRRREELKSVKAEARALEKHERGAEREAEAARKAAEKAQGELERATEALETARSEASAARERADARADALADGSS